jgi:hypothetical protein
MMVCKGEIDILEIIEVALSEEYEYYNSGFLGNVEFSVLPDPL